jgi:tRNA(Ile)-lysidine synthase
LAVRRAVVSNLADLDADALLLVACSGGADSLALAAGASMSGRRVAAVVVDHALQLGSAGIAEIAAHQCRSLGLDPVVLRRVDVNGGGGPEAAARTARYEALRQVAADVGATALLLGHTLDDQAETVLLRLARGSGARSLSAMSTVDGDLRRPLLNLRRSLVRTACVQAGLEPHEDPHNNDERYARSRLRHHALPALVSDLGDAVVLGLARSAASLRDDNEALDAWAQGVRVAAGTGPVTASIADLVGVPRAVRLRVIRRMALTAGSPASAIMREHLLAVDALISRWHGQGPVNLPGGVHAVRTSGSLVLDRAPGRHSAR